MSVNSSSKHSLLQVRHSYPYEECAKGAKPSVLQRFGLVVDFLWRNLGLTNVLSDKDFSPL